jgi:inorganic pyrophosphatase
MSDDKTVDVLVETPQGSRKKYEYDADRKAMRLDRRLFSATVYPTDYGFIPDTEGEDGEALDALVLTEEPTFPGCWVTARVIGVFWIAYDGQREAKIIAVPAGDPTWDEVEDIEELPDHLRDEISHFFDVYKDLEPGRTPEPAGYEGRAAALNVIDEATKRKRS